MQNVPNAETHRIKCLRIKKMTRRLSEPRADFEETTIEKRGRVVLDAICLNSVTVCFGDGASSFCGFGTLQSAQNL